MPRVDGNLTASFAFVDYRRGHSAGVLHVLGPDLLFARRESVRVVDRRVLGRDRPAGSLWGDCRVTAPCLLAERSAATCKRT